MFTRQDLRELVVLTAIGTGLGLAHLGLRPDLPVLAEPAQACTLDADHLDPDHPALAPTQPPVASIAPAEPMSLASEPPRGAP